MYSFLVLGIVPGTNIQITFQGWTTLMLSVSAIALLLKLGLMQLSHKLAYSEIDNSRQRQTIHASQLHNRLAF